MLKAVLVTVAATTLVFCDGLVHETLADGGPIIRHSKKVRHICQSSMWSLYGGEGFGYGNPVL